MGCSVYKHIVPDIDTAIQFIPKVEFVYVYKVHDGNTYWVSWIQDQVVFKTRLILYGSNCPSIPEYITFKNMYNKSYNKLLRIKTTKAYKAAEYVRSLIEKKWVKVEFIKPGAHADRFIAKVWLDDGETLIDNLIKNGYTHPFMYDETDKKKYNFLEHIHE